MLPYMPKMTCILFHLAVLCDSLRCGAYGHFLLWHIMKKCNSMFDVHCGRDQLATSLDTSHHTSSYVRKE